MCTTSRHELYHFSTKNIFFPCQAIQLHCHTGQLWIFVPIDSLVLTRTLWINVLMFVPVCGVELPASVVFFFILTLTSHACGCSGLYGEVQPNRTSTLSRHPAPANPTMFCAPHTTSMDLTQHYHCVHGANYWPCMAWHQTLAYLDTIVCPKQHDKDVKSSPCDASCKRWRWKECHLVSVVSRKEP